MSRQCHQKKLLGEPGNGVGGEKGSNQEKHGHTWHFPDAEPDQ
jgi:hypothetical protein